MNEPAKHHKGLHVLFFTEMWERFSYYGMRALLVLYLTTPALQHGFGLTRANALEIYAIFAGLIYFTPLLGGYISDKFIGQRKAVYIGSITMALGQFCLAFSQSGTTQTNNLILSTGLGLLIVGTGFFKPCMPTILGQLYVNNKQRQDSAFTIFYMGINVGAFLAPLVAGWLGEKAGWAYGFCAAGIGMIIGVFWFHFQSDKLGNAGLPPDRQYIPDRKNQLNKRDSLEIAAYILFLIVFVLGFLKLWNSISPGAKHLVTVIAAISIACIIGFTIILETKGKAQWNQVFVIFILCLFSIFFWAGYEQAGGTFNLFARENTNRLTILGEIPASVFQAFPPLFVIILAPLLSLLWSKLSIKGKDLSTPLKFSLGLVFLGIGFAAISIAYSIATTGIKVSPMWLVLVYFLHTVGELMLSPIGLSMVSKLSPPSIVSVMMGLWYASMAIAEYLAGMLESILKTFLPAVPLFSFLTITSLSAGIILLFLSPLLKKMMKS